MALRPESVTVAAPDGLVEVGMNALDGRLDEANFLGATLRCQIAAAGQVLHADAAPDSALAPGATVRLAFAPAAAVVVVAA